MGCHTAGQGGRSSRSICGQQPEQPFRVEHRLCRCVHSSAESTAGWPEPPALHDAADDVDSIRDRARSDLLHHALPPRLLLHLVRPWRVRPGDSESRPSHAAVRAQTSLSQGGTVRRHRSLRLGRERCPHEGRHRSSWKVGGEADADPRRRSAHFRQSERSTVRQIPHGLGAEGSKGTTCRCDERVRCDAQPRPVALAGNLDSSLGWSATTAAKAEAEAQRRLLAREEASIIRPIQQGLCRRLRCLCCTSFAIGCRFLFLGCRSEFNLLAESGQRQIPHNSLLRCDARVEIG